MQTAESATDFPDRLVEVDLNTHEKRPALAELLEGCRGPALDLGCGLAYYSRKLLPSEWTRLAMDVDLAALGMIGGELARSSAAAEALPLADSSLGTVLLTDVLEHCPDDRAVLAEVARVVAPGGVLIVSVPSLELGFPDFLTALGIETVHDQEGPERHHRPGYHQQALVDLLESVGFEVVEIRQMMRLGAKLMIDAIALAHLVSERLLRRRRQWTWGDLAQTPPPGLGLYQGIFPAVRGVHRVVRSWGPGSGFEIAIKARRAPTEGA